MALDLLSTQNLPADVRAVVRKSGQDQDIPLANPTSNQQNYLLSKSANYTKWTLTNDHTLIGNLSHNFNQSSHTKSTPQTSTPGTATASNSSRPVFSLAKQQSALTNLNKNLSTLLVSSDSDIIALT
jgi:hypothetical protein